MDEFRKKHILITFFDLGLEINRNKGNFNLARRKIETFYLPKFNWCEAFVRQSIRTQKKQAKLIFSNFSMYLVHKQKYLPWIVRSTCFHQICIFTLKLHTVFGKIYHPFIDIFHFKIHHTILRFIQIHSNVFRVCSMVSHNSIFKLNSFAFFVILCRIWSTNVWYESKT